MDAEARRVLAAGPDRHAQLGVPHGAPHAAIKAAYKRLCALHPDKNLGNQLAGEAFAVVSAAYRELGAAAAAAAGAQPQAAPPLNRRWQAFTGGQQYQAAASNVMQQQQQPQRQQSVPGSGGGGSQENGTPSSGQGGSGGGWQAASKWGKPAAANLLRVAPVPAVAPVAVAGPAAAEQTATYRVVAAGGRVLRPSCGSSSESSGSFSSSGSSGSDSDDHAGVEHGSRRRSRGGGGVKPATFYGSGSGDKVSVARQPSKQPSPQVSGGLYGMFGVGRRSSASQGPAWLGGAEQPPTQPEQQGRVAPPLSQEQQAEQQQQQPQGAGSRWGARSKLAELLHAPPVAVAVAAAAGLPAAKQQEEEQQEQPGRPSGARQQKRALALSSSSSEGSGSGSEQDAAAVSSGVQGLARDGAVRAAGDGTVCAATPPGPLEASVRPPSLCRRGGGVGGGC